MKNQWRQISKTNDNCWFNQKNWVGQMFDQIGANIRQLLNSLSFIYQSHGVEYEINHYYDMLIRVLAPIQLLATAKNPCIQQSQPPSHKRTTSKPQLQDHYQSTQPAGGYNQNRTILTAGEEQRLCKWIQEKVKSGKMVGKVHIMNKAKKMFQYSNFRASSGWCRRFLNRNQSARVAVEIGKLNSSINHKRMKQDEQQQQKQSDNYQQQNQSALIKDEQQNRSWHNQNQKSQTFLQKCQQQQEIKQNHKYLYTSLMDNHDFT